VPLLPVAIAAWAHWLRHHGIPSEAVDARFTLLLAVVPTIAAPIFLAMAVRGDPQIILSKEGFTLRSLLSAKTYYWSDGYDFELKSVNGTKRIAFRPRGTDMERTILLEFYRDGADEILRALQEEGGRRANGA
jgi:hypothetical protein